MKENVFSPNQLFLENESKFSYEETVILLSEHILNIDWKISAIHDLQATLKKNGKEVLPIKIFELCNPVYSGQLLDMDTLRIYSPIMPCRLSVYEKNDGKVYIARMDSATMAAMVGGKVEEVMAKAFADIEKVLEYFITD
ncbi:DUF302 domain-containing protein [Dysgonomonas sp. 511]|uniref:DUF302 domain-containing protein n=1 Tax=Dysgonomonas sp. 511 TaxID=2302930 RepID=UPI0013D4D774|nr:DUF302 domain-containing protein [Dysgonomonas sp. 511]NDV80142.1 DUF302 domain-containing protein [Dysgonomonas sp. 511]